MQFCQTQLGVSPDIFAVGLSDGSLCIINCNGGIENTVPNAHNGAVTSIAWSHDGSTLATGGEDGVVKLWSPQGHLRSKVAQLTTPVLALAWDGSGQNIICSQGNELLLKPIGPVNKGARFVGHTGVILCVTYCPVLDVFVSGGEDNTYRLWDTKGRCIYKSDPLDLPVTSVTFNPYGQYFCVGTYDCVLLCDPKGWISDRLLLSPNITTRGGLGIGSIYSIAFSPDGSAIVLAGASGSVATAIVFNMRSEWESWVSYSGASNNVYIGEIGKDDEEQVEVNSRVTLSTLGYDHLLVCTPDTVSIYPLNSLSTPVTIEASYPMTIKMCSTHFTFVDNLVGIRAYTYQGKILTSVKFPGYKAQLLTSKLYDVGTDIIVAVSSITPNKIYAFDVFNGKMVGTYTHQLPITQVALSSKAISNASDKFVSFVDGSGDLYILQTSKLLTSTTANPALGGSAGVGSTHANHVDSYAVKALTQVHNAIFHSSHTSLLAIADGRLHVFWCPSVYFIDHTIADLTITKQELPLSIGKTPVLTPSFGHRVEVVANNGTCHTLAISPIQPTLAKLCLNQHWKNAMNLCRANADNNSLWAILACHAISYQQIDVAELSFAQLNEVDKVEYMQYIRGLASPQSRAAELLLYCRRPDEAQSVLLQAGLTYRAIKLCIRTFRWERALQLAVQLKQHVDTVLYHRQLFLQSVGQNEHIPAYIQMASQVTVQPDQVKRKEEEEERSELANASPYTGHFLTNVIQK